MERVSEDYNYGELEAAYGYGSYFSQQEGNNEHLVPDFIFVVKNAREWHRRNMSTRPKDYSMIARTCGSNAAAALQRVPYGKMYYHSDVEYDEDKKIKYGVIQSDDFKRDCTHWSEGYAAFRLQKPHTVVEESEQLQSARIQNIRSALGLGLMTHIENEDAEHTPVKRLHTTIAGLSYQADIRMSVGFENTSKVANLVNGNREGFAAMYNHILSSLPEVDVEDDVFTANVGAKIRAASMVGTDILRAVGVGSFDTIAQRTKNYAVRSGFRSSIVMPVKALMTRDMGDVISYLQRKRKKSAYN